MKRKGWAIPFIVFFICTWSLIIYNQTTNTPSFAQTSELAQIPWEKDISEINQVSYSAYGTTVTAIRDKHTWKLTEPVLTLADSTYIYNIISFFISPSVILNIEDHVTDLTPYGITDQSPAITLVDTDGIFYELKTGALADSTSYYAYSPLTQCVYTLKAESVDILSTDLTKWRSKDYLNLSSRAVASIQITASSKTTTVVPHFNEKGVTFSSDQLNPDALNHLTRFLQTTRIHTFVVDSASNAIASSYGFDTPTAVLKLTMTDGSLKTFKYVASKDGIYSYALDVTTQNIYKIPKLTME